MSDYPLLALGGYETYQLAHIATYIADQLARHSRSARGRSGRADRTSAVRDIAGATAALSSAHGGAITDAELPRPLDRAEFATARELLVGGTRSADVVAFEGGYAVVGHVPGVGPVGARTGTQDLAAALKTHFLTQPAADLAAWAVTDLPLRIPTLPRQVDLAAFIEHLDPTAATDRAIARNLRGRTARTDAAIRGRFAHVDLDAPAVLVPTDASGVASRGPVRGLARGARRAGLRRPGSQKAAAATVPNTIAGP